MESDTKLYLLLICALLQTTLFAESHAILQARDSDTKSIRNGALNIDYGFLYLSNYKFKQADSNFNKAIHSIGISPEWIMFDSVGKVAVGTNIVGAWISRVNTSQGQATLEFLEAQPYLAYRFDYSRKQFLVPFLKLGPSGAWSKQTGVEARTSSFYTVKFNGGLEFLLNDLDLAAARNLDRSTGIHATYLNAEVTGSLIRPDSYQPQNNLANDGLRLGLRFEF